MRDLNGSPGCNSIFESSSEKSNYGWISFNRIDIWGDRLDTVVFSWENGKTSIAIGDQLNLTCPNCDTPLVLKPFSPVSCQCGRHWTKYGAMVQCSYQTYEEILVAIGQKDFAGKTFLQVIQKSSMPDWAKEWIFEKQEFVHQK